MKAPRILIVEDEVITSDHLRRVLGRLGYEIEGIAASGTSALEYIENGNPDLVLADIGLEGEIDGIEVAAQARERRDLPTVFLTAYSDSETLRRARLTEPYGYLVKPFVEQELHATIEIALQQKGVREQQNHAARMAAQTLIRTQEELSAVTSRLFRVQEEERQTIARDLHDDVGQRLALLHITIENLWQKLPRAIQHQHAAEFDNIRRMAMDVSHAVRSVSHTLHPSILDNLGLAVALRQLAEEFEERHSISTRFSARAVPEDLRAEISVPLYRITQEALQNAGKHAAATQVNIALVGGTGTLKLSIRDDGKGFDLTKPTSRTGLGIVSMAERAELISGMFAIKSRPGEGTSIQVSVPLTPSERLLRVGS